MAQVVDVREHGAAGPPEAPRGGSPTRAAVVARAPGKIFAVKQTSWDTTSSSRWDLLVRRDDVSACSVRPRSLEPLETGAVRLAVEQLVLTSNNVTYAALGDSGGYWTAFPAAPGFGRVPAWGTAVVEASAHPDVAVGSRCSGLLPMSTDVTVRPVLTATGFRDASAHRSGLDAFYSHYRWIGEPDRHDSLRTVVRTGFRSSFVLAELVASMRTDRTPLTVVLSSASSTTAIGTAECLSHVPGIRTHGLTSPGNLARTAGLELYGSVSGYADEAGLRDSTGSGPAVFLDLTRDPDVVTRVHRVLGERLRRTVLIGGTHSTQALELAQLPGPEPERFFAPAQERLHRAAVGSAVHEQQLAAGEERFLARAADWFRIDERIGPAELQDAFVALLAGPRAPGVVTVARPHRSTAAS